MSQGRFGIEQKEMYTARGAAIFRSYEGTLIFERQEFSVSVLCGEKIQEFLIGLPWLETRRLVADKKINLLTLGID